jgi:hypothetical protein
MLTLANTALASAERIAALNLNTARSMLEDGVSNAKAMLGAKDPQEALSVQASLAQPASRRPSPTRAASMKSRLSRRKKSPSFSKRSLAVSRSRLLSLLDKAPSRHRPVPTLPFPPSSRPSPPRPRLSTA